MTKLKLIFLALFITTMTFAQKFVTNIDIAPLITFESNKTTQSSTSFGFSTSISEYYKISEKLEVGLGIGYSSAIYSLLRHVDSPNTDYESNIKLGTINLPIILRYKTKSKWFFQASYGMAFVMRSKSQVLLTYSYVDANNENKNVLTDISDKTNSFQDNMHSFLEFGFGKGTNIKQIQINIQLLYQSTIGTYDFSHLGYRQAIFVPCYYDYKIRPQQIGLKIGIEI